MGFRKGWEARRVKCAAGIDWLGRTWGVLIVDEVSEAEERERDCVGGGGPGSVERSSEEEDECINRAVRRELKGGRKRVVCGDTRRLIRTHFSIYKQTSCSCSPYNWIIIKFISNLLPQRKWYFRFDPFAFKSFLSTIWWR